MRKYIYKRIPEGVYSTNVKPLPKTDDSDLEERPVVQEDVSDISKDVSVEFAKLSNPQDLRCVTHSNGKLNLFYSVFNPKIENAEIKGNEQEAQVAMLSSRWDKYKSKTDKQYLGLQFNISR